MAAAAEVEAEAERDPEPLPPRTAAPPLPRFAGSDLVECVADAAAAAAAVDDDDEAGGDVSGGTGVAANGGADGVGCVPCCRRAEEGVGRTATSAMVVAEDRRECRAGLGSGLLPPVVEEASSVDLES